MSWLKDNLAGVFSFIVVILTAVQGLQTFTAVSIAQLVVMIGSSAVLIIVPLVKAKWAGALKTGLDLLGAITIVLIPFIALWSHGAPITREAVIIIIIAVVKVLGTEFAVQIRTDWGASTLNAVAAG